ncbi:MAG: hypothetical protein J5881_04605 [Clostridia bacterium]|nr:hypothetical protein [Clostridia bacterium]
MNNIKIVCDLNNIENELKNAEEEAQDKNTKFYTHEEMKKHAERVLWGE